MSENAMQKAEHTFVSKCLRGGGPKKDLKKIKKRIALTKRICYYIGMKNETEKKSINLVVRLSPRQYERLRSASSVSGVSPSRFVRLSLDSSLIQFEACHGNK